MTVQPAATRLTPTEIRQRIGRLPRIPFAFTPTPLEEVPRLRSALGPGAPRLLMKRDDRLHAYRGLANHLRLQ